jgi:hypothetical protein
MQSGTRFSLINETKNNMNIHFSFCGIEAKASQAETVKIVTQINTMLKFQHGKLSKAGAVKLMKDLKIEIKNSILYKLLDTLSSDDEKYKKIITTFKIYGVVNEDPDTSSIEELIDRLADDCRSLINI